MDLKEQIRLLKLENMLLRSRTPGCTCMRFVAAAELAMAMYREIPNATCVCVSSMVQTLWIIRIKHVRKSLIRYPNMTMVAL